MGEPHLMLAQILAPLTMSDLWRSHWEREPYVAPASEARLEPLRSIAELWDLRALLSTWRGAVQAWRQRDGISASADQAEALYRAGFTLYFRNVERVVSPLRTIGAQIAHELGLAPANVCFEAFASRAESGAAAHFDFDVNFSLQLRGRKTWRIAPNASITNPLVGHAMGSTLDMTLVRQQVRPFPLAMPVDSRTFAVEPGGLVYLPRGFWHETHCQDESFSLNVVLRPESWSRALVSWCEEQSLSEASWREYLAPTHPDFEERCAERLKEMQKRVLALTTEDWIRHCRDRASERTCRYTLRAGLAMTCVEREAGCDVTLDRGGDVVWEQRFPLTWVKALDHVRDARWISAAVVGKLRPDLAPNQVRQWIVGWMERGLLEAAGGEKAFGL